MTGDGAVGSQRQAGSRLTSMTVLGQIDIVPLLRSSILWWCISAVLWLWFVIGASDSSVDLLPNPTLGGSWTKDLPTDDGQESDQIFAFDGKTTAIEVPQSKLNFDLGKSFTLSTWMKHESNGDDDLAKHGHKEHIVCHSDGDGMLFVCCSNSSSSSCCCSSSSLLKVVRMQLIQ